MQTDDTESGNLGNISQENYTALFRILPDAFEIDGV